MAIDLRTTAQQTIAVWFSGALLLATACGNDSSSAIAVAPGVGGEGATGSTGGNTTTAGHPATASVGSSGSGGAQPTTSVTTSITTSTTSTANATNTASSTTGQGAGGAGATSTSTTAASGTGGAAGTSGSVASTGSGAGGGGAVPPGKPLAFPGAVGFGADATGARGSVVYHVTTLADAGTGSFRDAVSKGLRIVVFDVGGYVSLQTAVSVSSNLTIAGQTAPGDGIGFMGREVSFSGSSNVIVRNVRFRQGTLDADSTKSGINLLNTTNMIFDHVSIEFAQWNNIDSVGAKNITVQTSIDADPIGQQFAAHTETGPYTWYQNVFANAHNRNPLAKANTQYINNVVYNFQAGYTAGNSAGQFTHDILGNYFIPGPSTTSASDAFYQMNTQSVYAKGNLLDSNKDGTLNGAAMGQPGGTVTLTAAWSPSTAAIPTQSAADAYAYVTAHAGAQPRDQVDTLVIADVTSLGKSGALWKNQTATNLTNDGYGTMMGGTAPVDTDGDGMPDAWETKYGLNPKDASDATLDFDHTGYTNIEKYINSLLDGTYPG